MGAMEKNNMHQQDKNWQKEYQAFLKAPCKCAPECACEDIRHDIHKKLSPSLIQKTVRMSMIHIASVFLVLLICPHLGVQIIPGFDGVTSLFLRGGYQFCMMMCGLTVISPSMFFMVKFLQPEFLKPYKKTRFMAVVGFAFVTLICLGMIGGQIQWVNDAPLWILGALTGGGLSYEFAMRFYHRPLLNLQH